ncbi:MAG TPA: glycine--tRNA ligase subunit alpha, partial [Anaeromyxobacteraceae bacterium]
DWVKGVKYREVFHRNEVEMSEYSFRKSDPQMLFALFGMYEKECQRLLAEGLPLAAYDYCLKCSHTFNLLDARGAISVTERVATIGRVRALAHGCARGYLDSREALGFPLLPARERAGAVEAARAARESRAAKEKRA